VSVMDRGVSQQARCDQSIDNTIQPRLGLLGGHCVIFPLTALALRAQSARAQRRFRSGVHAALAYERKSTPTSGRRGAPSPLLPPLPFFSHHAVEVAPTNLETPRVVPLEPDNRAA